MRTRTGELTRGINEKDDRTKDHQPPVYRCGSETQVPSYPRPIANTEHDEKTTAAGRQLTETTDVRARHTCYCCCASDDDDEGDRNNLECI